MLVHTPHHPMKRTNAQMRHFQAKGWTQFLFTFRRNLHALYRCVELSMMHMAYHMALPLTNQSYLPQHT